MLNWQYHFDNSHWTTVNRSRPSVTFTSCDKITVLKKSQWNFVSSNAHLTHPATLEDLTVTSKSELGTGLVEVAQANDAQVFFIHLLCSNLCLSLWSEDFAFISNVFIQSQTQQKKVLLKGVFTLVLQGVTPTFLPTNKINLYLISILSFGYVLGNMKLWL